MDLILLVGRKSPKFIVDCNEGGRGLYSIIYMDILYSMYSVHCRTGFGVFGVYFGGGCLFSPLVELVVCCSG